MRELSWDLTNWTARRMIITCSALCLTASKLWSHRSNWWQIPIIVDEYTMTTRQPGQVPKSRGRMIADARSRMSPIALLSLVVTGVITLEGAIRRAGCDRHSVKRGVDLYVAGTLALS